LVHNLHNLGTCYRKLRRLEDAKATYQKVLELDPYHPVALGFLGMVFHLLGDLDKAILKYHEALSIDPINAHILELLNIALESTAAIPSKTGETDFKQIVQKLRSKYGWGAGKETHDSMDISGDAAVETEAKDDMSVG